MTHIKARARGNTVAAYYNEIDASAAAWLRELIKQGHIADGEVDERSIEDVTPADVAGFTQCHFFAGIGVWSHALRCAGWPDDRPVWTGSCPCQPFSAAGKGAGTDDERHLWPAFFWLIAECRPFIIFGEQVSGKKVIGKAPRRTEAKRLCELWKEKEVIRVCQDRLERRASERVQGMQERDGSKKECRASTGTALSGRPVGGLFSPPCESERSGVQPNSGVGGEEDRLGTLRIERSAVRLVSARQGMERTVVGQNKSGQRLYTGQCEGGPVCSERRMRDLGRIFLFANRGGDCGQAQEALGRLAEEVDQELGEKNSAAWLLNVQADLEGADYACGATTFPACSVGAPHLRQRLYWVADSDSERREGQQVLLQRRGSRQSGIEVAGRGGLADASSAGLEGRLSKDDCERADSEGRLPAPGCCEHDRRGPTNGHWGAAGCVDNAERDGRRAQRDDDTKHDRQQPDAAVNAGRAGPTNGYWRAADWLYCRDGKWRPVEPSLEQVVDRTAEGVVPGGSSCFPLAEKGEPEAEARVMRLRGYGNAIVAPQATAFIRSYMEAADALNEDASK